MNNTDLVEAVARVLSQANGYNPDETWQEFDRNAALSADYAEGPFDEDAVFPTFVRWKGFEPQALAVIPLIRNAALDEAADAANGKAYGDAVAAILALKG